jgi:acyl-CoA reductase-like NAD-dependent aldehyde dehydrogenase
VGTSPAPIEVSSFAGGAAVGTGWIERHNPARTWELVGRARSVDPAGASAAVEAADRAFRSWRAVSVQDRAALLLAAADGVATTAEHLGPLLARELGKVLADCRGEMGFAAACLRATAEAAPRVTASTEVDDDAGRLLLTQEPFGVVIAIVPWNAPLILAILKVAPALATGNTVVVKPSPLAPLAVTSALADIAAHLPPGVLSVVHGDGDVGEAVVDHPLTRKVAFTGGNRTAERVARTAAARSTPLVLELGGNDAALFLDDAEFTDDVMERAVFGTFLTTGQVCMAAKRLYVPRRRADEFVQAYRAAADRVLVVGDPLVDGVTVGPMVSEAQRSHVAALIDDARGRGGTVHELGRVADGTDTGAGWFLHPTLVTGLGDDAPLVTLEQFGPSVPLLTYDDTDDAVARANDSEFGLASSVWSADEDRAVAVARRLEAGMTFINCHNRAGMSLRAPFGGMKRSGFGREFGDHGLAEYVQTHAVHAPAAVRHGGTGAPGNAYPGQT